MRKFFFPQEAIRRFHAGICPEFWVINVNDVLQYVRYGKKAHVLGWTDAPRWEGPKE
jgi:hypothetical protein